MSHNSTVTFAGAYKISLPFTVADYAGGGFVNTVEGNTAGGSKGGANQKGAGVWTKKRQKAVIIGYCKTSLYDPKNLDEFLAVASKKSAKASEA
jgi:hypothetical protein